MRRSCDLKQLSQREVEGAPLVCHWMDVSFFLAFSFFFSVAFLCSFLFLFLAYVHSFFSLFSCLFVFLENITQICSSKNATEKQ